VQALAGANDFIQTVDNAKLLIEIDGRSPGACNENTHLKRALTALQLSEHRRQE
jgi:hypothetical protein